MTEAVQRTFGGRLFGAARLDIDTYEDVEADTTATKQAALVVCLSAAALAIGSAKTGWVAVASGVLAELLGWWIWSGITYVIGDKLLRGTATWGELLRTIGFAQGPGLLSVLRLIPGLNRPVEVFVGLWKLVAVVIAIRQALDFGTGKAILTAILGFLAYVSLGLLLAMLLVDALIR
jgi:hypothetical protein